jgi:hypothetical protein
MPYAFYPSLHCYCYFDGATGPPNAHVTTSCVDTPLLAGAPKVQCLQGRALLQQGLPAGGLEQPQGLLQAAQGEAVISVATATQQQTYHAAGITIWRFVLGRTAANLGSADFALLNGTNVQHAVISVPAAFYIVAQWRRVAVCVGRMSSRGACQSAARQCAAASGNWPIPGTTSLRLCVVE